VAAFLADLRDSSLPTDRELVATNGSGPLTVAGTATATGLGPADAIDAHLVSCGLPGILRS
jgi:hypothetical protein